MIVGLVRLGKTPKKTLYDLASAIVEVYELLVDDCRLATELNMPSDAFDQTRRQYLASRMLGYMERKIKRPASGKILGVTGEDLYSFGLNFVFGQARSPGSSAIVSLRRLDPCFYGEESNEKLLLDRAVKEAIHELGHTFGLGHCGNSKCVMSFSNSIVDVDRKDPTFCKSCWKRLSSLA